MNLIYLSTDELNRAVVRAWAGRKGISVEYPNRVDRAGPDPRVSVAAPEPGEPRGGRPTGLELRRWHLCVLSEPRVRGEGHLVRTGQRVGAASGPPLVARGVPPRRARARDAAPKPPRASGHRRLLVPEPCGEEDMAALGVRSLDCERRGTVFSSDDAISRIDFLVNDLASVPRSIRFTSSGSTRRCGAGAHRDLGPAGDPRWRCVASPV
jgi:hypothetical protein